MWYYCNVHTLAHTIQECQLELYCSDQDAQKANPPAVQWLKFESTRYDDDGRKISPTPPGNFILVSGSFALEFPQNERCGKFLVEHKHIERNISLCENQARLSGTSRASPVNDRRRVNNVILKKFLFFR